MTDRHPQKARRNLLGGGLLLSGAAVTLLAGCQMPAEAGKADSAAEDAKLLNAALALEYEAIFAYQAGAESGLLSPGELEVALLFQGHHKRHRDLLIRTVERLGATPVAPEADALYADRLELNLLASARDVLTLARGLELGAADAYIAVLPRFSDPLFGQFSARIAADEVMHWTALSQALGQPLPEAALTFGAS
ncbi:MAG: ferritin-like domain-containing protein [Rhodospirillales bacterium]